MNIEYGALFKLRAGDIEDFYAEQHLSLRLGGRITKNMASRSKHEKRTLS